MELNAERLARIRSDAQIRPMRAFLITVGAKGSPRLSFGAMARSTCEAVEQHLCLAEVGERVEALAVGDKGEAFPIRADRQALECAELRQVQFTDAWHRSNDARARELDVQRLDVLRRVGAI